MTTLCAAIFHYLIVSLGVLFFIVIVVAWIVDNDEFENGVKHKSGK